MRGVRGLGGKGAVLEGAMVSCVGAVSPLWTGMRDGWTRCGWRLGMGWESWCIVGSPCRVLCLG